MILSECSKKEANCGAVKEKIAGFERSVGPNSSPFAFAPICAVAFAGPLSTQNVPDSFYLGASPVFSLYYRLH